MRIYISGPMSGYPDFNYPAFAEAKKKLQEKGLDVVSPHDIHHGEKDTSYAGYMRRDIAALLTCDTIVFLPNWENSKGAYLEFQIAQALSFKLFDTIEDLCAST